MEPKFQTSFIPKRQISGDSERISIVEDTNIFSLTASVVFIVTILLVGGMFGYKFYLTSDLKKVDAKLNEARQAIDTDKIKQLIDTNSRITTGTKLLERHLVTSKLLLLLGDTAIQKIAFTELAYQNKDNVPSIIIEGEAQGYSALASQSEVLKKIEDIKDPVFSNFLLTESGKVKYHFTARLDSGIVSYKKAVELENIEQ